jgi:hypothetical protein
VSSLTPYNSGDPKLEAPAWGSVDGASIDADGIKFGPFANGTDSSGAYSYALDGVRLKDIALLAYSERYTGGGGTGAAPYIIIATDDGAGGENHVTFTANTQPVAPRENTWQRWVVTKGILRYNNDAGGPDPGVSWDDIIFDHGDELVMYVQVQAGDNGSYSDGSTSHVKNVTIEANGAAGLYPSYTFGS